MNSPLLWSDLQGSSGKAPLGKRERPRGAASPALLALIIGALSSCVERPSSPILVAEGQAAAGQDPRDSEIGIAESKREAPGNRQVRVILPRQSPRIPFQLQLEADLLDPETCQVQVRLHSPQGGAATLEYALSEEAVITAGQPYQEAVLEAGAVWEDRILLRLPREGFHILGAAATLDGRNTEAYVEIGERPSAVDRGLRVGVLKSSQQFLRVDETDVGQ